MGIINSQMNKSWTKIKFQVRELRETEQEKFSKIGEFSRKRENHGRSESQRLRYSQHKK